jgi:hypothetical protein
VALKRAIMLGQQRYATGTHGQSADQVSALTIDGEPDLQAGSHSLQARGQMLAAGVKAL